MQSQQSATWGDTKSTTGQWVAWSQLRARSVEVGAQILMRDDEAWWRNIRWEDTQVDWVGGETRSSECGSNTLWQGLWLVVWHAHDWEIPTKKHLSHKTMLCTLFYPGPCFNSTYFLCHYLTAPTCCTICCNPLICCTAMLLIMKCTSHLLVFWPELASCCSPDLELTLCHWGCPGATSYWVPVGLKTLRSVLVSN